MCHKSKTYHYVKDQGHSSHFNFVHNFQLILFVSGL